MIRKGPNNVVYVDSPQEEMDVIKQIVENQQFATIKQRGAKKGVVVDLFTASIITSIFAKLTEKNKEKLAAMPLGAKIDVCYKILKKVEGTV